MTPSYRDETISLIDDLDLSEKKVEVDTIGFEHIRNEMLCGYETASFEERRKVEEAAERFYWNYLAIQGSLFEDEMY